MNRGPARGARPRGVPGGPRGTSLWDRGGGVVPPHRTRCPALFPSCSHRLMQRLPRCRIDAEATPLPGPWRPGSRRPSSRPRAAVGPGGHPETPTRVVHAPPPHSRGDWTGRSRRRRPPWIAPGAKACPRAWAPTPPPESGARAGDGRARASSGGPRGPPGPPTARLGNAPSRGRLNRRDGAGRGPSRTGRPTPEESP